MKRKENIKRKIFLLLEKTTENGASEYEALTALNKAQKLMFEYSISELELENPFAKEECKMLEVPKIKIGYDIRDFYNSLAELFDCKYFYTKRNITFFGFEQDTKLCEYFYIFIIQTCLSEIEKYKISKEYLDIKRKYHGKTIIASFAKGFVEGLDNKIIKLIQNKKNDINNLPNERGLVILSKHDKIKMEFLELDMKLKIIKSTLKNIQENAFIAGVEKGKKIELNKPISNQSKNFIT